MTKNIMIVGVGGQGTLLASRILGNTVINEGYDVKVSEVHGMSQRGGSVVTYVKYGEKVYSPIVDRGEADVILAFELLEAYRALPYLKKGSEVYQMGSLSSFQPVPYIAVYGATKAFVLSFTRAVNAEIKKSGIKMMAVSPGWVKTEFFDRAVTDESVITYYNQFFTSEQVVKRALRDMKKKKDVSVCGFKIRAQVLLTKLIPHTWVMKIWLKQQKKK